MAFQWSERITCDDDTVDAYMHSGALVPQKPDVYDLITAIEWLAIYASESPTEETAQAMANVIGLLDTQVQQRMRRSALASAKRAYAAEHGIPVSQVRVVR